VDYDRRRALLAEVKALPSPAPGGFVERLRPLLDDPTDGRIKLYLTWRTLQLRSRWPDVFRDGEYTALTATGAGAAHVVAYARRLGQRSVVVLVPRLLTRMAGGRDEAASAPDWGDTRIELPPAGHGDWHDVLTGRALTPDADGALGVGEALSGCPVALLVNDAALLAP
jgi:(1->4)-alpha-D-glucan 1-alpha-D-glucosylmutase